MKTMLESRYLSLIPALIFAVSLAGCDKKEEKPAAPPPPPPAKAEAKPAPKPEPKPEVKPAPKPEPKAEAKPAPVPVAAAAPVSQATPAVDKDGWKLIGQQQADRTRDRDRFIIGTTKGAFREIQIRIDGAPLEVDSMVVTFGNDQQFKPALRQVFDAKSRSRSIDLPGEKRGIKHIDFIYRSVATARDSKATVSIYGR